MYSCKERYFRFSVFVFWKSCEKVVEVFVECDVRFVFFGLDLICEVDGCVLVACILVGKKVCRHGFRLKLVQDENI